MGVKEYLLDSNIIIKLWKSHPDILYKIDATTGIDYKISKDIAGELSVKEYKDLNGVAVLSDKFLKLINHIIEIDNNISEEELESMAIVKREQRKNIYYISENKLSANDFKLIALCKRFNNYTLVTEDKKIYNSGLLILGESRVLNLKEFLAEINEILGKDE